MYLRNLSLHLLAALLLPLTLLSCQPADNLAPQDPPREELDKNLVRDTGGYRKAVTDRRGADGVEFSIAEVKREGQRLKVHVRGGCNETSFRFVWDGQVALSYPMQVYLVLTHQQAGEVCPAVEDHFLELDLAKLLGENANPEEYIFHVFNGSQKQDATLNPNGASSIRVNP